MAKKQSRTDAKDEDRVIETPIEWRVAENVPTYYATNLLAQHTPHEFILTFFELWPPALLGSDEERMAQAEALESLPAKSLARIVIAANRMPSILKALQEIAANHFPDQEESEEA